ncbi:hypothetical protein [Streptomyces sp. JW3]|uniref:hypothetical protein n=1 Tax=Streptomyces sp. JW3 TaxID=3456955 RepID=UPI003FA44D16
MEQLFMGLPERAERLRELTRLEVPVQQDADEVARMTDPRAGAYFFRAAVSGRWLGLLPLARLLPEVGRWPAAPYLRRLLVQEPERVCAWVEERLDAIRGQGLGALSQTVAVVSEAGMAACPLLTKIVRAQPDRFVLLRATYWAVDIPVAERTGAWVAVLESILRVRGFTAQLITEWSTPRLDTSSPLGTATTAPGGGALLSLTAWGIQHAARTGEGLPEQLTAVLEGLLGSEPDDQALAVIGFGLSQLHHCDPGWVTAHADTLLSLDPSWRPVRSWLTHGRPDPAVLARLDRAALWQVLCAPHAEGALDRVFLALLDETEPLGPASEFLAGLAGCTGGDEAVSVMLSRLATYTARTDSSEVAERACVIWRAALDAGLPAVALRGAGHFAFADSVDQDTWLELTAATVVQQPDLEDADHAAERAARTPASPAAQLIAAAALDDGPADGYHRTETIRHAAALYADAPAENTPEHEALRVALINAGAIDDAYRR